MPACVTTQLAVLQWFLRVLSGRMQLNAVEPRFCGHSWVILQAAMRLIEKEAPAKSEVLLVISGTSVIILSWSCAMKFSLAKVLKSSALRKDAVTSGAVATMAATILISTTIYKSHESVWWLDSAVAIIISFGLFVLGIRTLLKNPWWRCASFLFQFVIPVPQVEPARSPRCLSSLRVVIHVICLHVGCCRVPEVLWWVCGADVTSGGMGICLKQRQMHLTSWSFLSTAPAASIRILPSQLRQLDAHSSDTVSCVRYSSMILQASSYFY